MSRSMDEDLYQDLSIDQSIDVIDIEDAEKTLGENLLDGAASEKGSVSDPRVAGWLKRNAQAGDISRVPLDWPNRHLSRSVRSVICTVAHDGFRCQRAVLSKCVCYGVAFLSLRSPTVRTIFAGLADTWLVPLIGTFRSAVIRRRWLLWYCCCMVPEPRPILGNALLFRNHR